MFRCQATGSHFSGPWPRTGKSKTGNLGWLTSSRDFNNPIPDWKPPANNDLAKAREPWPIRTRWLKSTPKDRGMLRHLRLNHRELVSSKVAFGGSSADSYFSA